jgi:hypothetical protein
MLTQVSASRVARLGTLGVRGEDYHFFASCAEFLQEELTMCEGSLRGLRHTLSRECGLSERWDAVGVVGTLRSISM